MDWVYPSNFPRRQYQFDIVQRSLYKNTLVSLPTGGVLSFRQYFMLIGACPGLGKTFIAAVVMYNFYRWFPDGKVAGHKTSFTCLTSMQQVVFMAPTKPLVAQQIEACFKIMGFSQEDISEITGQPWMLS